MSVGGSDSHRGGLVKQSWEGFPVEASACAMSWSWGRGKVQRAQLWVSSGSMVTGPLWARVLGSQLPSICFFLTVFWGLLVPGMRVPFLC